jgi:diguanylate cyclase (GGDEF)-like protein
MNHSEASVPAVPLTDDPALRLRIIRNTFIDTLVKGMAAVASLGLISIFARAPSTGWHLASTLQLGVVVMVFSLFFLHKTLSYGIKVGGIFLAMGIVGLSGLPTFGLAATSVTWLVLASILANVIFSRRVGVIVMASILLVLILFAVAFITGRIVSPIDFKVHLTSPASWAGMIAVNCGGAFVIMWAMGTYSRSILALMQEVRNQNVQIQDQRNQIAHLANHDILTGLPSRGLARDRLAMACSQAGRDQAKAAVLFIDLDGFKAVNDAFNHEAGDAVLKVVAARLAGSIRRVDTAARQGGDEFLVILNGVDKAEDATMLAEKLGAVIAKPISYDGHLLKIGSSIGIAVYPDHASDADELLKAADQAMYLVKRSGKGRFGVYAGNMPPKSPHVAFDQDSSSFGS